MNKVLCLTRVLKIIFISLDCNRELQAKQKCLFGYNIDILTPFKHRNKLLNELQMYEL